MINYFSTVKVVGTILLFYSISHCHGGSQYYHLSSLDGKKESLSVNNIGPSLPLPPGRQNPPFSPVSSPPTNTLPNPLDISLPPRQPPPILPPGGIPSVQIPPAAAPVAPVLGPILQPALPPVPPVIKPIINPILSPVLSPVLGPAFTPIIFNSPPSIPSTYAPTSAPSDGKSNDGAGGPNPFGSPGSVQAVGSIIAIVACTICLGMIGLQLWYRTYPPPTSISEDAAVREGIVPTGVADPHISLRTTYQENGWVSDQRDGGGADREFPELGTSGMRLTMTNEHERMTLGAISGKNARQSTASGSNSSSTVGYAPPRQQRPFTVSPPLNSDMLGATLEV